MAKATTGATCPLCDGDLTDDLAGKGFVRHKHRPTMSALMNNPRKRRLMTDDDVKYLRRTGRCPYQRGQRD